jgi:hypothetical protein
MVKFFKKVNLTIYNWIDFEIEIFKTKHFFKYMPDNTAELFCDINSNLINRQKQVLLNQILEKDWTIIKDADNVKNHLILKNSQYLCLNLYSELRFFY